MSLVNTVSPSLTIDADFYTFPLTTFVYLQHFNFFSEKIKLEITDEEQKEV